MRKIIGLFLVGVMCISLFSITAMAKPKWKEPSCPIDSDTDFVYYSGSGASSLSQSWMVHFLDWWQDQDSSISYMDLSAAEIGDCDFTDYSDLDLYIQPGGNAYSAQRSIGSDGKNNINSFLNNGGAYFGACAGWYYASGDYYWQGSYYDHNNLLGAYPSTIEGSITPIADYDGNPEYAVTELDNGFNALYWGGPTFGWTDTLNGAGEVMSNYVYQDLPAVVVYNNMLLTSVHLEAYENDGFTGLTTDERIENYKYLANLINYAAGTNFYVPDYATPPVDPFCGDNVCNGDETYLTCSEDCDEPLPGPIFEDDFSNGFSKWTTSGTGISWSIVSNEAYVKKTGVSKYSYMTADVTSGGTFSYDRKLVGLDAADDFSAEYYDGTWNYVEHLGSGRENGNYVSKSFTIPSGTSKIRFMCETGAVSEKCYVDNVKIE